MPRESPVTPGFKVWCVEYYEPDGSVGPYEFVYLHIPDEVTGDLERRSWVRDAEAVPTTAEITFLSSMTCQVHTFSCSPADHTIPLPQPTIQDYMQTAEFNPAYTYTYSRGTPEPATYYTYWERDLISRGQRAACDNPDCFCNDPISSIEHED